MQLKKNFSDYINQYYKLENAGSDKRYELNLNNINKKNSLPKNLKDISLIRVYHSKNIVLQKKEIEGHGPSIRISLPAKTEEYYVGTFNASIECSVIIIADKRKNYLELFISEKVKNNAFTLYQMLQAGELDKEISFYRNAYNND